MWRLGAAAQLESSPETVPTPHQRSWISRLVRLNERQLLFSAGDDGKVVEWVIKIDYHDNLSIHSRRILSHHRLAAHSIDFCAPVETMVSAGCEHVLFCWHVDAPDWMAATRLEGHTRAVSEIFASRQTGNAFSSDVGGTIRTWDLVTRECIQAIEPMSHVVGLQRAMLMWPGEVERLITVGGYREWHLYTQRRRQNLQASPVTAAVCVPRLDLMLVAQESTVRLVHARHGLITGSVAASSGSQITRLCLDPETRCLLLGFSDGTVSAWLIDENIDGQAGATLRGRGAPERLVPFTTWLQVTPLDAIAHLITRADPERAGYFTIYAASANGPSIHMMDACSRATKYRCPPDELNPLPSSPRRTLINISIAERQQLLFVGLHLPAPSRALRSLLATDKLPPECELQLWHLNGKRLASSQRFPFDLHAACVVTELSMLICCAEDGSVSLLCMPQLKWLVRLKNMTDLPPASIPMYDPSTTHLIFARDDGAVQVWCLPDLLQVVEQRKHAATRRAAARALRRAQSLVAEGVTEELENERKEPMLKSKEPQIDLEMDATCARHPGDARPYEGHTSTSFITALAATAAKQPELVAPQHQWHPFPDGFSTVELLGDDSLLTTAANGETALYTTAGVFHGRLGLSFGEASWEPPRCLFAERDMILPLWLEDCSGPTWGESVLAAEADDREAKQRLAALRERREARLRSRLIHQSVPRLGRKQLESSAAARLRPETPTAFRKTSSSMPRSASLPTLTPSTSKIRPLTSNSRKTATPASAASTPLRYQQQLLRLDALLHEELDDAMRSISQELLPVTRPARRPVSAASKSKG